MRGEREERRGAWLPSPPARQASDSGPVSRCRGRQDGGQQMIGSDRPVCHAPAARWLSGDKASVTAYATATESPAAPLLLDACFAPQSPCTLQPGNPPPPSSSFLLLSQTDTDRQTLHLHFQPWMLSHGDGLQQGPGRRDMSVAFTHRQTWIAVQPPVSRRAFSLMRPRA